MMSLDLAEVSQCVLPGNNRNEVELQFPESDAVEANNDQLVSIRFYIPPDPDVDPADRTTKSNAELLQQRIMQMANIRKTTGDVIGKFDMFIIELLLGSFINIMYLTFLLSPFFLSFIIQSNSIWKKEVSLLLVDDTLSNYVSLILCVFYILHNMSFFIVSHFDDCVVLASLDLSL